MTLESNEFLRCVQNMTPLVRGNLPRMIKHFEKVINSRRTASSIKNFEELVEILVKRDLLDPDDKFTWIDLNKICEECINQPFYASLTLSAPSVSSAMPLQTHHSSFHETRVSTLNPQDIDFLSNKISFSWRSLARGLKLVETEINRIETKHGKDYSACVREVLQTYEKNMLWASESNGNAEEDILKALGLLREANYLVQEYSRLICSRRR